MSHRQTHCKKGHELSPDNVTLRVRPHRTDRLCTICHKARQKFHNDNKQLKVVQKRAEERLTRGKQCNTCKNWKSPTKDNFNKQSRMPDGLSNHCRECDKGKQRKSWLKCRYGLTPDTWETLFDSQDRKCASCKSPTSSGKGWHVDHDHDTQEVCGILCHNCNTALGKLGDGPYKVELLLQYAQRTRQRKAA